MKDIAITIIQADLHSQDKAANLANFEQKIASIEGKKQIVLLPEMFSTGFSMQPENFAEKMDGATIQWMRTIAQKHGIILGGSLIIEENGSYRNRFVWMQPNGQYQYYDKRHLFAYGGEDKHYQSGEKRIVVQANGWRFLLLICYDLRFPVWTRQQADENGFEYDAILYVANWPAKRSQAWKSLLVARAIENQCFVVGVNRVGNDGNNFPHSGDSQFVNPLGEIEYISSEEESIHTAILSGEYLEKYRNQFPFYKDADTFSMLQ